jgi:hypothetical protein
MMIMLLLFLALFTLKVTICYDMGDIGHVDDNDVSFDGIYNVIDSSLFPVYSNCYYMHCNCTQCNCVYLYCIVLYVLL